MQNAGILINHTITHYKVNDRSIRKVKKPQIIGMVQIEGSHTAIINRLLDIAPEELKIGMKVKIKWEEKTKGEPSDIRGFVKYEV